MLSLESTDHTFVSDVLSVTAKRQAGSDLYNLISAGIKDVLPHRFTLRGDGLATFAGGGGLKVESGGTTIKSGGLRVKYGGATVYKGGMNVSHGGLKVR